MKGHIRERQGKRIRHWETVHGNKRDAQVRLRELLTSLDNKTYIPPSKVTVEQWLAEWVRRYAEAKCSPKTVDSYQGIINHHIVPVIGKVNLMDLEPDRLSDLYAAKRGTCSVRTIRYCHTLMSQALDYAIKQGKLKRNVALLAEPPAREKKAPNVVEAQDVSRFLKAAADTPYSEMVVTLLFTGLRRGELLALRWKDLDLARGKAYISRTMYRLKKEYVVKETKTASSQRVVALPTGLCKLLADYYQRQVEQRKLLDMPMPELVFTRPEGEPFDPSTFSHAVKKVSTRAGLDIKAHALRHSFATLLLKAGKHPLVVSAQLGHSSVRTTLDVYSHVLPGLQEAAARSLETFLPPQLSEGNR